jgi:hypothetical protein
LAQRRSEYKEQMNTELPYTEWKEWKTSFIKGVLLRLPLMHCSACIDDNDMVYAKVHMPTKNQIHDPIVWTIVLLDHDDKFEIWIFYEL